MINSEHGNFRVKYTQNYFMPSQVSSRTVHTPFRSPRQHKLMMINIAKEEAQDCQLDRQLMKINRAQVSGRDSYKSSQQSYRIKSRSLGIHNIKVMLQNNPLKIIDMISSDPEKHEYEVQLNELQKMNVCSPQQILCRRSVQKQYGYPFIDKSGKQLSLSLNGEKQSVQYYEQLILNNPILFRKILLAYKMSKRQMHKEQRKMHIRKLPLPSKNTIQENSEAKVPTRSSPSQFHKTKSENSKKSICFWQFREFQIAVNLTNRLVVQPPADIQYRAYICKGNNGLLIKSIIKSRPWWSMRSYSQLDTCNLIWTEWKKSSCINKLSKASARFNRSPCKQPASVLASLKLREYAIKLENRRSQVRKIVDQCDELWSKYEKIPQLQNYFIFGSKRSESQIQDVLHRIMPEDEYTRVKSSKQTKMCNHIPGCLNLHSKKLLFLNLKNYYQSLGRNVFSVIPLTFHITKGSSDSQFIQFTQYFQRISRGKQKRKCLNIWICKPGQNSNRGNGISVLSNLNEIKLLADQRCKEGHSLIIQKYMENPFLYNRRKFDIRCYILITTVNGIVKGYWYEQGYIRTASKEFSLKNLENKFIHLTNDAVQKKGEEYGKFQNYNKVSYNEFEKYLEGCCEVKIKFQAVVARIKTIATDLILSVARKLNPSRRQYCFELFGLDFMLDDRLDPFLLEANSNPCIEVDGSVLGKVIPSLLENVIRVAVDPVFPSPLGQSIRSKYHASNSFQQNKMTLVYDSFRDEQRLTASGKVEEASDQYQREENQCDLQ